MTLRIVTRIVLMSLLLAAPMTNIALAQQNGSTRVVGLVRDEINGITLPGVIVELVGTKTTVYTDVDGKFMLDLPPGKHEIKVSMEGYDPRVLNVQLEPGDRALDAEIGLRMSKFTQEVTVVADVITVDTSTQQAQLEERKRSAVVMDNVGAQEMRRNADSDAAQAMSRVTGLSVVDNQYVFVRGLGERYSNTTLSGSVLPTTEPDKKVVPLDLFPAGLLDSVQVSKTYSPDKSAEFAGGLVQIIPLKLTTRPVMDFGYKLDLNSISTGEDMPQSPLGSRDWWGYDNGARAIPSAFPNELIVRQGIYTADEVGFPNDQIVEFGRMLENRWTPQTATGAPGGDWVVTFGDRFDNLGIIASVSHQYRERFAEEERRFFVVGGSDDELEPFNEYTIQSGTQKAQLGVIANFAYQLNNNHRLLFDNFYSHSGRDEGRFFEGPNYEANFYYKNYRVQFIEEGLMSNAFGGEHFVQNWGNSRVDWRVTLGNATRDEPDLRETLYQANLNPNGSGTIAPGTNPFLLADESQSGYRMFSDLEDDTLDIAGNWSIFRTTVGRPTQWKFGLNYVDRTREFTSRRFRFIPIIAFKDAAIDTGFLSQPPETLFAPQNIGYLTPAGDATGRFRFNEETKAVDAYDATLDTFAVYGMADMTLSARTRLIAGLRVEAFDEQVDTLDRFALVPTVVSANIEKTDFFPSLNLVQAMRENMNLRLAYSTTVNRPEFRELAAFEFTDVVGNRAVTGNPNLTRALIQNVDARVEAFTGARGVLAASAFFKYFDDPIERIVIASAQPLASFQNAESARNFGIELEIGREIIDHVYVNANYSYVSSEVTLKEEQLGVQTSDKRPLAGQSDNLFNVMAEYAQGGFVGRVLYNFMGDRISDVGSSGAPDIIEQGRGTLDLVLLQRISRFNIRASFENLTDSEYEYTQFDQVQRSYTLGRTFGIGVSFSLF